MDINFKENDFTFNYRVAAIIRYQDKLLVEKNSEVDYYGLIGGRCKLGEDSITAIKREILEEINDRICKNNWHIRKFFYISLYK